MKKTQLCQHSALPIKTCYVNSSGSLLPFKIAWFCSQIPTRSATEITFSVLKEWRQRSEVCHPGPPLLPPTHTAQPSGTVPLYRRRAGGDGLPINLVPGLLWPKNAMWVRMAYWNLRVKWLFISPYCLVQNNPSGFPSRNQSLAASSLNSHLCLCKEVQIAPPGAASPGGFILMEGKHCLHNYPLSNSSPGRQLSSRDSPQLQLHSGMH